MQWLICFAIIMSPFLSCTSRYKLFSENDLADFHVENIVTTVATVNDFLTFLKRYSRNKTLVVFDVDDTVIMPTEPFRIAHPVQEAWLSTLKDRVGRKKRNELVSRVLLTRTIRLVEPSILEVLAYLLEQKIPALALTALYTGEFGFIENMEEWRIAELHSVGVNFSRHSPVTSKLTFPELEDGKGVPQFRDGVIFTATKDKARVLERFLEKSKLQYQNIIFIDDKIKYLKSVAQMCARKKVSFFGFHYTAVANIPPSMVDEAQERKRLQRFENTGQW